jgi:hypothetical protein
MERAWTASSFEDEAKGMDFHLGVEGSNFNEHGEEIDKEEKMRNIFEGFQKYSQTRRANSRKLKKVREKQGEFNIKFLKSFKRIEKKLEKESEFSRTESHQTSEGIISRSVGRHPHHSQGRSKRRTHSISSPSPTKNHKRSGVDELKGEMNKIKPPAFDGEH